MLRSSAPWRRRLTVVAAVWAALTIAACGDDDDDGGDAGDAGEGAAGVTVTAADFAFEPSELTVSPGQTITLRNEDDVAHSFTIDDPAVDVEAEGGDEADVSAPEEAGTYDFRCRYHPDQMTGSLTVE